MQYSGDEMATFEVLSAVDDNPRYVACVKWFVRFWTKASTRLGVNVNVRIVVTSDSVPSELAPYASLIEHVPTKSIPRSFGAQTIRLLAGAWSDRDLVMTTDIDMFPLNQRVTARLISEATAASDAIVIGRDVLPQGQYPICYTLASPMTWSALWKRTPDRASVDAELLDILMRFGGQHDGVHGGTGWDIDQQYLYQRVLECGIDLILLKDEDTGHERLDRIQHRTPRNWLALAAAAGGHFSDYHAHLPVDRHRLFNRVLYALSH